MFKTSTPWEFQTWSDRAPKVQTDVSSQYFCPMVVLISAQVELPNFLPDGGSHDFCPTGAPDISARRELRFGSDVAFLDPSKTNIGFSTTSTAASASTRIINQALEGTPKVCLRLGLPPRVCLLLHVLCLRILQCSL